MAHFLSTAHPRARRLSIGLLQVLFVILLISSWQILASSGVINAFVVGTPLKIWANLVTWANDGSILAHSATTMLVTMVGYFIALAIGVTVGTVAGTVEWFGKVISPFTTFWQGFPRLVFYPFFAVALGYSISSRMFYVAFVIVFVIVISTAAGVADVDPDVNNHARIIGATRWDIIKDVRLPAAVLWVGTSARITFGFAVQAAIVAEFTGASSGLGYLMILGQNSFDVNIVWAAILVAVVFAVAVDALLVFVQRYFSRWRPQEA